MTIVVVFAIVVVVVVVVVVIIIMFISIIVVIVVVAAAVDVVVTLHVEHVELKTSHSFRRTQTLARLKQACRRLNPTKKQLVSLMGGVSNGYHVKYLSMEILF